MTTDLLLLDRDGVICENRDGYVRTVEEFRFLPGAVDALVALSRGGYRLVVVTNQSMIGRGLVAKGELVAIHRHMRGTVERAGGTIADVLVCEHAPDGGCECRKPRPGLLLEARRLHGGTDDAPFMVGDHLDDVTAALEAGCRPIHVATGRGVASREAVRRRFGNAVRYFDALPDAAAFLLAEQAARSGAASTGRAP